MYNGGHSRNVGNCLRILTQGWYLVKVYRTGNEEDNEREYRSEEGTDRD